MPARGPFSGVGHLIIYADQLGTKRKGGASRPKDKLYFASASVVSTGTTS